MGTFLVTPRSRAGAFVCLWAASAGLSACGGSLPEPTSASWAAGKPIYVDVATTDGSALSGVPDAIQGVRRHFVTELSSMGFSQAEYPSPTLPTLRITSIARNSASGALILNGMTVETYTADVGDCTSWAWGVVADANEACLARGLARELSKSPHLRSAAAAATPPAPAVAWAVPAAPAPVVAAPPPVAPTPAGCGSDKDCHGDRICDRGQCVNPR